MRVKRENNTLLFTFNLSERQLFLRLFSQLSMSYRLKPGELDFKTVSVWYSTCGCNTAKMSEEETKEWVDHLHSFKSANLQRLKDWSKQLTEMKLAQAHLRVNVEDAPAFMIVINDHRLRTAVQHDIGQPEMDIYSPLQLLKLASNRQEALLEIHFLAWILEETLRVLQDP